MRIPEHIIANADDLGFDSNVNAAILASFERGYINSTSLMTNMAGFEEAAELIHSKPAIKNIGIHVNLAEGKPLTNVRGDFLDADGNWDVYKTNKVTARLNVAAKTNFMKEIDAQVNKALSQKIPISHLDSHLHLHTLPCFYKLFLTAAKQHKLKLRLAQTYNEGSVLKYYYRKYINSLFRKNGLGYTDRFETVERCLEHYTGTKPRLLTEVMFHPRFDEAGDLTDNFDPAAFRNWLEYLAK
ncbi:MAG: ChbG/HpnK family deacetylase [Bacteroidetes bacterium]|nr:ChbG/HpnK family deacetylase [Bacteroidota bacterium]